MIYRFVVDLMKSRGVSLGKVFAWNMLCESYSRAGFRMGKEKGKKRERKERGKEVYCSKSLTAVPV